MQDCKITVCNSPVVGSPVDSLIPELRLVILCLDRPKGKKREEITVDIQTIIKIILSSLNKLVVKGGVCCLHTLNGINVICQSNLKTC